MGGFAFRILPASFLVVLLVLSACGGKQKAKDDDAPIGFGVDTETISDSQNFETITAQESIETDAQRLARLSDEYIEYRPEPLPERPKEADIDLSAYAEKYAKRRIGKKRYSRVRENGASPRVCQTMPSNDFAQFVFLSKGGPKEDHLGLDHDGDGFACGWRP